MTPAYGASFTVWCNPDPETTLWPFQFKDGYIDPAFVRMRYRDPEGLWHPVRIDPRKDFPEEFTLRIVPPVPPAVMVEVYRDTPKDTPIVIYGNGGTLLTGESRNAAVRQGMHVVVELKELANRSDLPCLCDCVGDPVE